MKKRCIWLVAVVIFLTSLSVADVFASSIINLNNSPVLSVRSYKNYVANPYVLTTRTINTLPYSETGVTANKDNQLIATADYNFYSNPDAAQFRIDYTLYNHSPQYYDDYTAVNNEYSHFSRIQIHNMSSVDILYSFSSELEMIYGTQDVWLQSNFRASDYSETFFNSSQNDRYLAEGNSLIFNDTGILPANTIGHFYYSASLSKRARHEWIHTNAMAEGFFDLEFKPAPVPIPTTLILFGTGLVGLAGLRKKFKK